MATAKAAPVKKAAPRKAEVDDSAVALLKDIKYAPVDPTVCPLKLYPDNPNEGDIPLIAESLRENRQVQVIAVQKSTQYVLGGNHTLQAMQWNLEHDRKDKRHRWQQIAYVELDVDDEEAARIVVALNETARRSHINAVNMAKVIARIKDATLGTGLKARDVEAINSAVKSTIERTKKAIADAPIVETIKQWDQIAKKAPSQLPPLDQRLDVLKEKMEERYEHQYGEKPPDTRDMLSFADVIDDPDQLEDIREAVQGVLRLSDDALFELDANYWGIPPLREDMLCEKLPKPIDTWGGNDVTPDDGKTWYVYNYGKTMKGLPLKRSIFAFFSYDDKFENWWIEPSYYVSKMIAGGVQYAIGPDFSYLSIEPRVLHLHNHYKEMWLCRYMQECGIKIIPRIMWNDLESLKYVSVGIPRGAPVVCTAVQSVGEDELVEGRFEDGLREYMREIQPKQLLVYTGAPGKRAVERSGVADLGIEVIYIDNWAAKRRGVVFDSKKKKSNGD